jgi:hypothetical protein
MTVPTAKQKGGCVTIGGMTVCPHVVYLTNTQKKAVYKMHRQNALKMKKLEKAAKQGRR